MDRDHDTGVLAITATLRECDAWVLDAPSAVDEPQTAARASRRREAVIEELPVALVYNGISHAVMLASPADLDDFALGFSLTEGIVASASEVHDIEVLANADGIEVRLTIAGACMAALKSRRRALAGRTGCGLCGVETLRDAVRPVRVVSREPIHANFIDRAAIARAFDALATHQHLHQATGAAHAAGFADRFGVLALMREDVGRHNALDKLVGAMAPRRGGAAVDAAAGFIVVTSRASYEMVHKTAAAGVGLIAALAAPTALAIRTAERAGVTLVGCAARDDPRIFSHPQRMIAATHPREIC